MIPGIHEAFHCNIARMLGYEATAHFPTFFSGYVLLTPYPTNILDIFLIGIAGGGMVALFYALIALFTNDWETDLIMRLFVPLSASYALLEPIYLLGIISLTILSTLPSLIAISIFGMLMLREGSDNSILKELVRKKNNV